VSTRHPIAVELALEAEATLAVVATTIPKAAPVAVTAVVVATVVAATVSLVPICLCV
jgi:hypothetical protein